MCVRACVLVQKHAPSGTIEIKDIRMVTNMAEDGSFQVCCCCDHIVVGAGTLRALTRSIA